MIKTKAMKKYDCIVTEWYNDNWVYRGRPMLFIDWDGFEDKTIGYTEGAYIREQLIAVREGWTE